MILQLQGRDVEVIEYNYQFDEGAEITEAAFLDDGTPLSEAEIYVLQEANQDKLCDEGYQKLLGHAERMADLREDR